MQKKYTIILIIAILVLAGVIGYFAIKAGKKIDDAKKRMDADVDKGVQSVNNASSSISDLAAKSGDFKTIADDASHISDNINALLGRNNAKLN